MDNSSSYYRINLHIFQSTFRQEGEYLVYNANREENVYFQGEKVFNALMPLSKKEMWLYTRIENYESMSPPIHSYLIQKNEFQTEFVTIFLMS